MTTIVTIYKEINFTVYNRAKLSRIFLIKYDTNFLYSSKIFAVNWTIFGTITKGMSSFIFGHSIYRKIPFQSSTFPTH